jgi:sugar lactone lactonase YvrE
MQYKSPGGPGGLPAFLLGLSLLGPGILALPAVAGQTRTWTQSEYADFEKGIMKDVSLRSDGLLTLAPRFREVLDTSSAYLWALARDSKGNLYAGGGPGAKLYRLSPGGEKKTLAELDGLEIPAIAIDAQDRVYAASSPDGKVYRVSPDGKCEVFYDPKTKYIWALSFNKEGDLFVATGDPGAVHRVTPDGHGSIFFQSDETHVRSMTVDPARASSCTRWPRRKSPRWRWPKTGRFMRQAWAAS